MRAGEEQECTHAHTRVAEILKKSIWLLHKDTRFFWKWLVLRYVTPIKRIREQRVSAHLLFLFFKLLLGFGLDFEFGFGLTLGLDLRLEFGLGLGLGLGLE